MLLQVVLSYGSWRCLPEHGVHGRSRGDIAVLSRSSSDRGEEGSKEQAADCNITGSAPLGKWWRW